MQPTPDSIELTWNINKTDAEIRENLRKYDKVIDRVVNRYTLDLDKLTEEEKEVMDQAARIFMKHTREEQETIH